MKNNSVFTFCHITLEKILKEISNLDVSKSSQDIDALSKIIKENSDIFAPFICESSNNMINSSIFPEVLKLTHKAPVFKKVCKNSKENYRLDRILSNITKSYENCMYKKMSDYFGHFLSEL